MNATVGNRIVGAVPPLEDRQLFWVDDDGIRLSIFRKSPTNAMQNAIWGKRVQIALAPADNAHFYCIIEIPELTDGWSLAHVNLRSIHLAKDSWRSRIHWSRPWPIDLCIVDGATATYVQVRRLAPSTAFTNELERLIKRSNEGPQPQYNLPPYPSPVELLNRVCAHDIHDPPTPATRY